MTNVREAREVRLDLSTWCEERFLGPPPSWARRVLMGPDAYILNKGNVTPGFLAGLADDVAALAVHAHPQ